MTANLKYERENNFIFSNVFFFPSFFFYYHSQYRRHAPLIPQTFCTQSINCIRYTSESGRVIWTLYITPMFLRWVNDFLTIYITMQAKYFIDRYIVYCYRLASAPFSLFIIPIMKRGLKVCEQKWIITRVKKYNIIIVDLCKTSETVYSLFIWTNNNFIFYLHFIVIK